MVDCKKIFMIVCVLVSNASATELITQFYYIKNELKSRINVQITCGSLQDKIAISRGKTARFFTTTCKEAPTFSVIDIGTTDSLAQVQKKSLSLGSYARIYQDATNKIIFENVSLEQNAEPGEGEGIETYAIAL